tara:strand:+ start:4246 stop:5019 length:774 start_codon:yes stop_codon:yes gene_type:complete
MPRQPKESKLRQMINDISEENEYKNLCQNRDRARSITVGTCGGGSLELHMRGDYHSSWILLTPVEALELAEQLAAASGVHIAMKPKNDFSAWRGWNTDNVDYSRLLGQAPYVTERAKQLDGERERARLPFEPNNPENKERIEEFIEKRSQYENEPHDNTSVAPRMAPIETETRLPEEELHELHQVRIDKQVDEAMARVELEKEPKFDHAEAASKAVETLRKRAKQSEEHHASVRKMIAKSNKVRDAKRKAKVNAEAK